ncbi:PQQ-dependent sugar dehydrogenase [Nocardioides kribbensis]|uniref:PQQ-dependent sugar dehydrogenase n=1 Tax=Nocardioides kribbensis TaxID=305517 RepID=UPI00187A8B9D|nr:PQQ-dependent sugar dehydrogenase [Nocardioides kribbensis]
MAPLGLRRPARPAGGPAHRGSRLSACAAAVLAAALLAPAAPTAQAAQATPDGHGPTDSRTAAPGSTADLHTDPDPAAAPRAVPRLTVSRVASGLDHPWDVRSIGEGRLLVTQRDRAALTVVEGGETRDVDFPSDQVWVSGETGLMGLEVDPRFADNGRIYTCQGATTAGGGHDVRVVAWTLDDAATTATRAKVLLKGLPASSGRHGGCRLLIARDGSLLVGTGDAAVGTNPRDLTSLGGKTLRLDRRTGAPWPGNPFPRAKVRSKRYVHTYGHRNVQGLAQRADGSLWSVEQGSFRDDEVNRLRNGGDYGWHPVPGYNEQVPMTDRSLPGTQVAARWRSGPSTVATCGATFVRGKQWGALRGALAVAVLKDTEVLFLTFDARGDLRKVRSPAALKEHGRIRQVTQAPGGALLLTTDNGDGNDVVLRVTPA